jgi:hypothetical protein
LSHFLHAYDLPREHFQCIYSRQHHGSIFLHKVLNWNLCDNLLVVDSLEVGLLEVDLLEVDSLEVASLVAAPLVAEVSHYCGKHPTETPFVALAQM